jgi:hypothetical protein
MLAALNGHKEAVMVLLEAKADVHAANKVCVSILVSQ